MSGSPTQPAPGQSPVTIRRIDHLLPAIEDDLCRLLIDAVHGGASVGFLAPLDDARARRYWRGVAAAVPDDTWLWIAEEAGRVVGTVQLGLCHKENGRHRAEVQKLQVLQSGRRRGIASQLMAALERDAAAAGRTLLVLDTTAGSVGEPFYVSQGWTKAGELPDYAGLPDGTLRPTALYWKRIG